MLGRRALWLTIRLRFRGRNGFGDDLARPHSSVAVRKSKFNDQIILTSNSNRLHTHTHTHIP